AATLERDQRCYPLCSGALPGRIAQPQREFLRLFDHGVGFVESRETEQAACELVGARDDELRQHERPRLRPGRTQPSFCSTERPEETRRAAAADQCPQAGVFVEAAGGVSDLVRQDERALGVRVVERDLELELECVEVCLALAGCEGPTPSSDV